MEVCVKPAFPVVHQWVVSIVETFASVSFILVFYSWLFRPVEMNIGPSKEMAVNLFFHFFIAIFLFLFF